VREHHSLRCQAIHGKDTEDIVTDSICGCRTKLSPFPLHSTWLQRNTVACSWQQTLQQFEVLLEN